MKKRSWIATLLFSALSATTWAGTFTVGVEATDYMPISKGDTGGYTGFARELLDAFASKYGHTFTYKALPVARLYSEFAVEKSIDFKFPDNAHWGTDVKKGVTIAYSKGLVTVTEGLMVLPAHKGKTVVSKIVTLRGFTPYPYLDQINAKKITVTEVNTAESALSMVEAARADGVYMGKLAATHIMGEVMKKPGVLVFDDTLPNSKNDFSLSTIARPEVIKQMDEFLVKEKDTVAKLKAKYKIAE